jgi:hypothetical protein
VIFSSAVADAFKLIPLVSQGGARDGLSIDMSAAFSQPLAGDAVREAGVLSRRAAATPARYPASCLNWE